MISFEPNTPGIYRDLPADVYHKAPGVSNSMLGYMDPPARLPIYLRDGIEETPWMRMGTLIHQRILEPSRPIPALAIQPAKYPAPENNALVKSGAKKAGDLIDWHNGANYCKDWHKAHVASGKLVVTSKECEKVVGCIDAIRNTPEAIGIFDLGGDSELSCFAEIDGLFRKCRIDYRPNDSNALVEIKKVQSGMAHPSRFIRLAVERGYHRQAAGNLDIWNAQMGSTDLRTNYLFVVVEEEAPFLVNVIRMGQDTIDLGRRENGRLLSEYRECVETGVWRGYKIDIDRPVEAQEWVFRKEALAA